MRPDFFIGRVSDGIPALRAFLRSDGPAESTAPTEGVGGAVLEYRVAYHTLPQAGDRFEIRSGLADVGERTLRYVHWMLDPETGRPWATAEAVAIMLDLTTRKIAPISEGDRKNFRERLTADLSL
jgi:acyl-CoA thioester hydrolase